MERHSPHLHATNCSQKGYRQVSEQASEHVWGRFQDWLPKGSRKVPEMFPNIYFPKGSWKVSEMSPNIYLEGCREGLCEHN